jgi:hypothetical protein
MEDNEFLGALAQVEELVDVREGARAARLNDRDDDR